MNTDKRVAIVTKDKTMLKILSDLERILDSNNPVLITGETGTGKELIADYIHFSGSRSKHPFVKVGLSALPPDLIESELFGHEKGAFTNALNEKRGLFELADKGSIFLDDIDDFPFRLQSKLLRVLESNEVMRIGSEKPIPINVRFIAASKINLADVVASGKFRADLYYRLKVIPVTIPPLRQRPDDIPLLVNTFLTSFSTNGKIKISDEAVEELISYKWPGNVRELKNLMKRLAIFSNGEINLDDLPSEITVNSSSDEGIRECLKCYQVKGMSFCDTVKCLEYNLILRALKETGGNKNAAARKLKMKPSTFRDKLAKYKIKNYPR